MDKWEIEPNYNGGGITKILSDRDIQKGIGAALIPVAAEIAKPYIERGIKKVSEEGVDIPVGAGLGIMGGPKVHVGPKKQERKSLNKSILERIDRLSKAEGLSPDPKEMQRQLFEKKKRFPNPKTAPKGKKGFGQGKFNFDSDVTKKAKSPQEEHNELIQRNAGKYDTKPGQEAVAKNKALRGQGPPVQAKMNFDKIENSKAKETAKFVGIPTKKARSYEKHSERYRKNAGLKKRGPLHGYDKNIFKREGPEGDIEPEPLDKSLWKAVNAIDAVMGKLSSTKESALDGPDTVDGDNDTKTRSVDIWTMGTPSKQGCAIDGDKKKGK